MTTIETRPSDEAARLAAVRRYDILDTPPDGAFDRITALAARLLGVPVAIVSIVDRDRIWFKSHHGLPDVDEVGRDPGLCASAILQDEAWVVRDAAVDPRTLANPLVAGDLGLRFYAGIPLHTADAFNLGTLCVLDFAPRDISDDELAILGDLAGLVMDQLELRLAARETVAKESALRRHAEQLADTLQATLLPPRNIDVPGLEVATRYLPGARDLQIGGDFFDVFRLAGDEWGLLLGDACGKGPRAASLAGLARWSIRATAVHKSEPSDVLADLNAVLRAEVDSDDDDHFCSVVFARLEPGPDGAAVTIACGGHPPPLVVRANGDVEQRGVPGDLIGMFDDVALGDDRVLLGPGDAVVFYTDGITEARAADGGLFGQDGLRASLTLCAGEQAEDLATCLVSAAHRYDAVQRDDIAVLVVRVPGAG